LRHPSSHFRMVSLATSSSMMYSSSSRANSSSSWRALRMSTDL
jgi:hypothetical protein